MSYTKEQEAKIELLLSTIINRHISMAVVDYLGRMHQIFVQDGLKVAQVTEDDPERFGVRDMRHVEIYKLKVVRLNKAAEKAGYTI